MKVTHPLSSLFLLATLGSLGGAPSAASQAPKQDSGQIKPKEAVSKPESTRELSFTVTGLTKDNLAKAKESLQALAMHVYTCEPCKVEQATAGTCPKCQGALAPESHPILSRVEPSADFTSVALTIGPGVMLKLSELESTLGKCSIHIDDAHLVLPGRARLVVQGAKADAVPVIEKALADAKLFEEVRANYDATKGELLVAVRAGASAPTRAKVVTALEGAKVKLADVVWSTMGAKS